MFLTVLILIIFAAYLLWSLIGGKIFLTKGTDLRRQTVTVDRQTSPITFWVVWSGSTAGLVIFTLMLLRNLWN